MSRLRINNLNHYQSFIAEDASISGGQISVSLDNAAKVRVKYPGTVLFGYASGIAVAIGKDASTSVDSGVI